MVYKIDTKESRAFVEAKVTSLSPTSTRIHQRRAVECGTAEASHMLGHVDQENEHRAEELRLDSY